MFGPEVIKLPGFLFNNYYNIILPARRIYLSNKKVNCRTAGPVSKESTLLGWPLLYYIPIVIRIYKSACFTHKFIYLHHISRIIMLIMHYNGILELFPLVMIAGCR